MLSPLIINWNKKDTEWIWAGIPSVNVKPFDACLEPKMSNLANSGVNSKTNDCVLVQKSFLHCIATLF